MAVHNRINSVLDGTFNVGLSLYAQKKKKQKKKTACMCTCDVTLFDLPSRKGTAKIRSSRSTVQYAFTEHGVREYPLRSQRVIVMAIMVSEINSKSVRK
jgi:hypothetical protein